ncbi:MAG: hypothetical protein K0U74_15040 [Alphaproteobacteria bacterium]|nr:hypothetical protein [Alphaproteobacteria bacterium]
MTDEKDPTPENVPSQPTSQEIESTDEERRAAMLRMGAYAAAVAPAMLVLTSGKGIAQGRGNGNGNGHAYGRNCDGPGLRVGIRRNGHSGC